MKPVDKLHETLRTIQEPKGFPFNPDKTLVRELLEGLLINRERYGYMVCPCRLASGNREWDRDIVCPCIYRQDDILEYGSCYCGLYVSPSWNEGQARKADIPERRPQELMRF